MRTGMTSVTFRSKTVDEIIAIVKEVGLTGIEWGGDIHVPAGNLVAAADTARKCRDAKLEVLSYGSYFHADEGEDFAPVLASAVTLGAPLIRIWAGRKSYEESTAEELEALAARIRAAAEQAQNAKIDVAFEFHRGTATQTKEGALALLRMVKMPNVRCYWQPNPDVTFAEQLAELDALRPYLANIHIFNWTLGNVAHPLAEGANAWNAYLSKVRESGGQHDLILEFVKDGADEAFRADAAALLEWTTETSQGYVLNEKGGTPYESTEGSLSVQQ